MSLERLDDQDYPAFTVGQAAQLLGVQQAFLRRLDTAGLLTPQRSTGGHRRYSRRQLQRAARIRALFDAGHGMSAAQQILQLQDERDHARDELDQALTERDDARHQRDHAREQRDAAREQADEARQSRDEAYRLLAQIDRGRDRPPPIPRRSG